MVLDKTDISTKILGDGAYAVVADLIASEMRNGGITVEEIQAIVAMLDCPLSVFPGNAGDDDCPVAFFCSLTSKFNRRGKGHLSFSRMIDELLRHTRNPLAANLQTIVIITDTWRPDVLDKWAREMTHIESLIDVAVYLISPSHRARIPLADVPLGIKLRYRIEHKGWIPL